jgi:hypothetical protein
VNLRPATESVVEERPERSSCWMIPRRKVTEHALLVTVLYGSQPFIVHKLVINIREADCPFGVRACGVIEENPHCRQ